MGEEGDLSLGQVVMPCLMVCFLEPAFCSSSWSGPMLSSLLVASGSITDLCLLCPAGHAPLKQREMAVVSLGTSALLTWHIVWWPWRHLGLGPMPAFGQGTRPESTSCGFAYFHIPGEVQAPCIFKSSSRHTRHPWPSLDHSTSICDGGSICLVWFVL